MSFTQITDEYRQRHYPEGYFASLTKPFGGVIIIICGLALALIGVLIGLLPIGGIISKTREIDDWKMDISVIVIFSVLALALLAGGIFFIVLGIKRLRMGKEDWIRKCAEISDYSESTVQEFEAQVMRTDAFAFQLDPTGATNILSTDYIMCGNLLAPCLMKISDIVSAYIVCLPDTIMIQNKVKNIYTLNVAIFSNHGTSMLIKAKEQPAGHLLSLLKQRNQDIITAGGRVLNDKEYEAIVEKMTAR